MVGHLGVVWKLWERRYGLQESLERLIKRSKDETRLRLAWLSAYQA